MKSRSSKANASPLARDILGQRYGALVVANGIPPSRSLFQELKGRSRKLLAVDGGVNVLRRWNIAPDYVVGDFDSASHTSLLWARGVGAKIIAVPSQERSDLDKGLAFCRRAKLRRILLTGIEGDAIEHILYAISSVASVRGLDITLVTRRAVALVLRGRVSAKLPVPSGHTISWFGCPAAGPCTLRGVKWPVEGQILKIGSFNSLSNLPTAEFIDLRQKRGISLLVINMRKQRRRILKLPD